MTTRNLIEAASLVSAPSEGATWKVRLINEGRGSSGVYSKELLESYHHAFDDVISFLNHPTSGAESRNFTEIAGRVVGETWLETAEDGTTGVYANWEPDEDHRRKLEKYKDKLGLSIYISGAGEEDDQGDFRVTELDNTDPFRSVDVVIAAGRGGRFEESAMKKMYESRRDSNEDPSADVAGDNRKENTNMAYSEEQISALIAAVESLVSAQTVKVEKAVEAEAIETAVSEARKAVRAQFEAIESADLTASQKTALLEAAEAGQDVSGLIESAAKIKAEALAEAAQIAETAGRDFGGDTKEPFNPLIEGWIR